MSKFGGLNIEFEELGQVALFALLLAPGVYFIRRARSGAGVAIRTLMVGGFLASAALLEGTLDRTANELTEEVSQ